MNFTEEQKKQLIGVLIGAIMLLVVQGAAAMGIDVMLPRVMPPAVPPTGVLGPAAGGEVASLSAGLNPYDCRPGTAACLRSYSGRDLAVYSDSAGASATWTLDGATGNMVATGSVTGGSAVIGGGFGSTGCTLSAAGVLQCDGAATLASTLAVTGTSTFTGAATFTANPILPSESITPTDGADITISKVLVTLTPAGAVGNSLAACTTGNQAYLYNSVNANVVITDTGNAILAGNQTLGQYDSLHLVCIATKWVQVGAVSGN